MKISKKQINKAGEIIRNGTVNEKEQTIELLNLWRANHMLPLRNIRAMGNRRQPAEEIKYRLYCRSASEKNALNYRKNHPLS